MNCKICNTPTSEVFKKTILKKYPATYYRCSHCGFMQTSEETWIEEAYSSAITKLDIGLLDRNIYLRNEVSSILDACFPEAKTFLDYAGGYGVFVRLMRDAGYNFYRQDIYCENIFSQKFDISDVSIEKFDVVTAFEVFEHFLNPLQEIMDLFKYSDNVIFSTQLLENAGSDIENWWYVAPETGQHVAFYSIKTMELIAGKLGKKYYSKNNNLHLFTSKQLNKDQIDFAFKDIRLREKWLGLKKEKLEFKINRPSLLQADFEYLKSQLQ